jgi:hypothetical protein
MRSFKIVLAGLTWAVFAIPGLPQTPEIQKEVSANLDQQRTQERYEQIEILRRLLDQGLRARGHATAPIHSTAFSPDGKLIWGATSDGAVRVWDAASGKQLRDPHASLELPALQGVYLKGHGVVYTTTLPAGTLMTVMDGGTTSVEKPLTEWERVRSEVRGEKQEPKKPKTNPSLAYLLLKSLADNGKYMTQLPEGESITVAVTLSSMQSCTSCHGNPWSSTPRLSTFTGNGGTSTFTGGSSTATFTGGTGGSGTSSTGTSGGGSSSTTSVANNLLGDLAERRGAAKQLVLLGDLHLKQKKYREATETFLKANEIYTKMLEFLRNGPLEFKGNLPLTVSEWELDLLECRTKLAQSLLAEGKQDEARKVLADIAAQAQRGAQTDTAKPAEKPVIVLPSKLIVSASKKALEAVGSGKMSFEEFRKAATIEYLTFDKGPEKAPAKP